MLPVVHAACRVTDSSDRPKGWGRVFGRTAAPHEPKAVVTTPAATIETKQSKAPPSHPTQRPVDAGVRPPGGVCLGAHLVRSSCSVAHAFESCVALAVLWAGRHVLTPLCCWQSDEDLLWFANIFSDDEDP